MRMFFAAMLIGSSSLALAQSSTSTDFTTAPTGTAPSSVTQPNGQKKVVMPPAARAGEKGLRVGEGAATGEPIEIKRNK